MHRLIAHYFNFVILHFSWLFFIHHVDPIIEEVDSDTNVAFSSMDVQVYDPLPSCAYV